LANTFNEVFPEAANVQSNELELREQAWPPIIGEYLILSNNSPIAVSTLANSKLIEEIYNNKPQEVCIVGKLETENIGIEKIIKNTITNPNIHVLLLCGAESEGHYSGQTLLSLINNGVDENMRVIKSFGKKPVLVNTSHEEIETFRQQVQVVDLIGCEDLEIITQKIKEIFNILPLNNFKNQCKIPTIEISNIEVVQAKGKEPEKIKLDQAGYFVITPNPENSVITVEHYSYKNKLLRVIEGKDARSIYLTLIENNWASDLGHAAYLGKELSRAELSIKLGFKYVQDGA